jgi:hypothetical protein
VFHERSATFAQRCQHRRVITASDRLAAEPITQIDDRAQKDLEQCRCIIECARTIGNLSFG